jgi:hypothetical protein
VAGNTKAGGRDAAAVIVAMLYRVTRAICELAELSMPAVTAFKRCRPRVCLVGMWRPVVPGQLSPWL